MVAGLFGDDGGTMAKRDITAAQVARWCDVDLKTVHNWEKKGKIKGYRTPGRHLRFTRETVVAFLAYYGYLVPEELKSEGVES